MVLSHLKLYLNLKKDPRGSNHLRGHRGDDQGEGGEVLFYLFLLLVWKIAEEERLREEAIKRAEEEAERRKIEAEEEELKRKEREEQ